MTRRSQTVRNTIYLFTMSDTESSISIPTDETLREALRLAVAEVYKSGDLGELTVKRIRAAAEQNLDLPSGFFKGDFRWKGESDRVIKEETVGQPGLQLMIRLFTSSGSPRIRCCVLTGREAESPGR